MANDTRPGGLDAHHRAGDPPIKITREIPLPWLIAVIVTLIVNAVTMWTSQERLIKEVNELRVASAAGTLQLVRLEIQHTHLVQRVQQLEAAK